MGTLKVMCHVEKYKVKRREKVREKRCVLIIKMFRASPSSQPEGYHQTHDVRVPYHHRPYL